MLMADIDSEDVSEQLRRIEAHYQPNHGHGEISHRFSGARVFILGSCLQRAEENPRLGSPRNNTKYRDG